MILHCVFRWASIFPISFGGVPDLLVFHLLLLLLLIFNESLLLTKYKIKIMFFFLRKQTPSLSFYCLNVSYHAYYPKVGPNVYITMKVKPSS